MHFLLFDHIANLTCFLAFRLFDAAVHKGGVVDEFIRVDIVKNEWVLELSSWADKASDGSWVSLMLGNLLLFIYELLLHFSLN